MKAGVLNMSAPLTDRDVILSKFLMTPAGRAQLAASMVSPLKTRRDYVGCPVCHRQVHDLLGHAAGLQDEGHVALSVMES